MTIAKLEAIIAEQRTEIRKLQAAIGRWQKEHEQCLAAAKKATDSDGTLLELIGVLALDVDCEYERAAAAEKELRLHQPDRVLCQAFG